MIILIMFKVYILDPLFASWLKNNYFGGTW